MAVLVDKVGETAILLQKNQLGFHSDLDRGAVDGELEGEKHWLVLYLQVEHGHAVLAFVEQSF